MVHSSVSQFLYLAADSLEYLKLARESMLHKLMQCTKRNISFQWSRKNKLIKKRKCFNLAGRPAFWIFWFPIPGANWACGCKFWRTVDDWIWQEPVWPVPLSGLTGRGSCNQSGNPHQLRGKKLTLRDSRCSHADNQSASSTITRCQRQRKERRGFQCPSTSSSQPTGTI